MKLMTTKWSPIILLTRESQQNMLIQFWRVQFQMLRWIFSRKPRLIKVLYNGYIFQVLQCWSQFNICFIQVVSDINFTNNCLIHTMMHLPGTSPVCSREHSALCSVNNQELIRCKSSIPSILIIYFNIIPKYNYRSKVRCV